MHMKNNEDLNLITWSQCYDLTCETYRCMHVYRPIVQGADVRFKAAGLRLPIHWQYIVDFTLKKRLYTWIAWKTYGSIDDEFPKVKA